MSGAPRLLTSTRLLARNILWNLGGAALPALAALFAVPPLVHGLGDMRFGVLALAWTALGYFSLFDLGIGRAVTHGVAHRLGRDQQADIGALVWTSFAILLPLGVVGALTLYGLAPWLVRDVLKVAPVLREETVTAFRVLAVAIPFTGATAALRGVLEANQRFGTVNALRVPYGLLTFLGPLAALPFTHSLVPPVMILTLGRVALFAAFVVACKRLVPRFSMSRMSASELRALLTFGGWMTVSNIVSPLMNTLDRFVIGAVLGVSVVTYYVTPHELVTKMWLFTAATFPVFFPAFVTSASTDPRRAATLFDRAVRATIAVLFLPTVVLVLLAPEILQVWLGGAFAANSATVMQILAIAVFVNCLAQAAYTLIQSLGRPDLTGKYHLAELPLYALLLWALIPYGILGFALAWAIRVTLDAILLLCTCPILLPDTRGTIRRTFIWVSLTVVALSGAMHITSTTIRTALVLVAAPLWVWHAWQRLVTPAERTASLGALGLVPPPPPRAVR